jgi:phosphopantothenoylcysteine decarboxylase/phosphopantothenate--cysteine ligase
LTLHLVKNPDILRGLSAGGREGLTVVGFAAETAATREALLDLGGGKARRKGADLLVVNGVGWSSGFGSDDNDVMILDSRGALVAEAKGSKRVVADVVFDEVVARRQ